MKIVLANAVGKDREGYYMVHSPSRWSLGVKNYTNCHYYPWELSYTSALLKRETGHDVKLLDGVLKKWDVETYLEEIGKENPDFLIMESSSRTISEDKRLAKAVKRETGAKVILTGQHPTAFPKDVIDAADYICLGEYEYTVLDIIRGEKKKEILGLYPNRRRPLLDIDSLPFPEDEDISRIDYHEPNCEYKEIQMYTSRGCPMNCIFCVARYLYYERPHWRRRRIESIIHEIQYLKDKYPLMEGLFFDEEVHNVSKKFIFELTEAIRANDLSHLKYDAMCQYVSLDEKVLDAMKSAGYYKVRIGIETASPVIARENRFGKKFDLERLNRVLRHAKKIGLKIYGTFTIGALGSTRKEDKKTVEMIRNLSGEGLLPDIQVSINTPQPGTPFYNSMKEKGLLLTEDWSRFDGARSPVVSYPHYSHEEIRQNFEEALSAFDAGTLKYNKRRFVRKARRQLGSLIEPRNILLLRTARMWHTDLILESLFKQYQKKVDVLAQDSVVPVLSKDTRINQVYSYGNGFFNPDIISDELYQKINQNRYDMVVMAYNSSDRNSYQNIFSTIKKMNSKKVFGFFKDGSIREEAAL